MTTKSSRIVLGQSEKNKPVEKPTDLYYSCYYWSNVTSLNARALKLHYLSRIIKKTQHVTRIVSFYRRWLFKERFTCYLNVSLNKHDFCSNALLKFSLNCNNIINNILRCYILITLDDVLGKKMLIELVIFTLHLLCVSVWDRWDRERERGNRNIEFNILTFSLNLYSAFWFYRV